MRAFIRDEDGVFISLATVTKIRREAPNLRTREENPQTPWMAETQDGEQHRFWVRDDEEGVQRMLATVIPAAPGALLYRICYGGNGEDYHESATEVYSVICWRVSPGKVEPVIIPRDGDKDWPTYSRERMNLLEAPPGDRLQFYELGGLEGAYDSLDAAKNDLIRRAKAWRRRVKTEHQT